MITRTHIAKLTVIGIVMVIVIAWTASFSDAQNTAYELRPEVAIAPYQSETTRVMDAYERLMNQYMSLVRSNMTALAEDTKDSRRKLDDIVRKLDTISVRIARIERTLKIEKTLKIRSDKPADN